MNKLKSPLLIVANGEFPSHSIPLEILTKANSIIACDGAADILLDRGYIPDIIIGDLDSISDDNKHKYKDNVIEIQDQSQNDFRKALNYARERNIFDISIIGALITTIIQAILVSLYSIQGAAVAAIISFSPNILSLFIYTKDVIDIENS